MNSTLSKKLKSTPVSRLPGIAVWYAKRRLRYALWGLLNRLTFPRKIERIGRRVKFNGLVRVEHPYSRIEIEDDAMIGVNCYFLTTLDGHIRIGRGVSVNDSCYLTSCFGIEIGDHTSIAEFCSIRDYNHEFGDPHQTIKSQGFSGAPIVIKDDVWLGKGVTVLPGVTIGRGTVVGAHAVVNKDLPDYCIAVGVPARVVGTRKIAASKEIAAESTANK